MHRNSGGSPAWADSPPLPDPVVDRPAERTVLSTALTRPHQSITLSGPHGAGKTLFTRYVLRELPETRQSVYLSCIDCDTQYKVLQRLYEDLAGDDLSSGYHTAHLHNEIADLLTNQETVLVLDDIGFLLLNDGNDLLYFLSRLDSDMTVVMIAAAQVDLAAAVDERTYSSLHPRRLRFEPYTPPQCTRILEERFTGETGPLATDPALDHITATTANIHLGLLWLTRAAELAADADVITKDDVVKAHEDAVRRYRLTALEAFSRHHMIVLKAIEQLTADQDRIYTGAVYDQYKTLCRYRGIDPLTTRRVSDFIDHLDLLGLITVVHYRGGRQGKTRHIELDSL